MPSSLLQVVDSLFQQLGTSSAKTTCWQLVNRFVTTCLQTCNNLCVFTCHRTEISGATLVLCNPLRFTRQRHGGHHDWWRKTRSKYKSCYNHILLLDSSNMASNLVPRLFSLILGCMASWVMTSCANQEYIVSLPFIRICRSLTKLRIL
jgi:hypothetical protein